MRLSISVQSFELFQENEIIINFVKSLLNQSSPLYLSLCKLIVSKARLVAYKKEGRNAWCYLIETSFDTFANRADPDQAALVRQQSKLFN